VAFTIEVESFDRMPSIQLIRHKDKYRIYNKETNKYLILIHPHKECYEWQSNPPDFDKVNTSSWWYPVAKRIVYDHFGGGDAA